MLHSFNDKIQTKRSQRGTSLSSAHHRAVSSARSSLLYHEESPCLVLRPTAPEHVWRRLRRNSNDNMESRSAGNPTEGVPVQEVSLVGWSYPAILEKVLPLFQASCSRSSTLSSEGENETLHNEKATNNGVLQALEVLNIISTELWVSSEFRSPYSLGVDRVTAALLCQPCSQNLHTLCFSRACNKSSEDWFFFCTTLKCLRRLKVLEFCDAKDAYALSSSSDRPTSPVTNVSLLFNALAEANLPLQCLTLHLNAYQPGRLSLRAWHNFACTYHEQLEELSLHMVVIREGASGQVALEQPLFSFGRLHMLHLTFVDFDSNTAWQQFLLNDNNGLLSCRTKNLQTLSLVCPSITSHQYETLWSHVFAEPHFPHLERFFSSAVSPHLYHLLSLNQPSIRRQNNNNRNTMGPLYQVQPRLQQAMLPTLSQLLECWRQQPPARLLELELPFETNDNPAWSTVQSVWQLYQTMFNPTNQFNVHDRVRVLDTLSRLSSLDTTFHLVSHCGPNIVEPCVGWT